MKLSEDVKAAQVWIGNGHRQVRQNGSSVLVKPHLTPSIPKNVYSWFPKESVLHRGRQSNTSTCFTQHPHRNSLTDLSGQKGHPVPDPKFSLHDVIPTEKIITVTSLQLLYGFIQCLHLPVRYNILILL